MTQERGRVDQSFSKDEFQKSLTGSAGVEPDLDQIEISSSGEVQPAGSDQGIDTSGTAEASGHSSSTADE